MSVAAALLSACDQPVRESEAYSIAEDVADAKVQAVEARVDDLEAKVADLESQINGVRALGLENAENTKGLVETVNSNVEIDRRNILARATNEGRCGTTVINHGGWIENRPVQCTPKLMGWE